jgi:hypothetical protein
MFVECRLNDDDVLAEERLKMKERKEEKKRREDYKL